MNEYEKIADAFEYIVPDLKDEIEYLENHNGKVEGITEYELKNRIGVTLNNYIKGN